MTTYVEPWLEADDAAQDSGWLGWVSRDQYPVREVAEEHARRWLGYGHTDPLQLTPVLLRLESDVEAAINGHEFAFYVECTERARSPHPYWRVEVP